MIKCSLCNSHGVERVNTKIRNIKDSDIGVYKCDSCGVNFLYPYYSEEELARFYNDEYRNQYNNEEFYDRQSLDDFFNMNMPEAQLRLDRVKTQLKDSDKILEIGCANGYFLQLIKDHVGCATGTELDKGNAAYAQSIGLDVRNDMREFNTKFDKVFMFHVYEHISDPVEFLNNLQLFLNEEGKIYIEVPNCDDILLNEYKIQEFKDFYYQSAHKWYFNNKSLKYIADQCGLNVEVSYVQRYDISNHMNWMNEKKPGGQGKYDNLFSQDLKKEYKAMLVKNGKADTVFAVFSLK